MDTEDCSDEVGVVCGRVLMVGVASFVGDTPEPVLDEVWEVVSMATSSLGVADMGVSSSSLAVVGVASGNYKRIKYKELFRERIKISHKIQELLK